MKYTYMFDEANPDDVKLLGGKASGLVMMTKLGLPVPYGLVITTQACKKYYRDNKLPDGLMEEVRTGMHRIEEKMGRRFGDPPANPLLVSVRSGAAVSMPGMMDTVLNLGLNDETVKGLAKYINSEHAALDAYRRFLSMFGKIVLGIKEERFNESLNKIKAKYGVKEDPPEIPVEGLKELIEEYKAIYKADVGYLVEDPPWKQLELAIDAVFKSWNSPPGRSSTGRPIG